MRWYGGSECVGAMLLTRISLCLSVDHSAAHPDRSSSWSRTSGCSTVVKNRQRGIAPGYLHAKGGAG